MSHTDRFYEIIPVTPICLQVGVDTFFSGKMCFATLNRSLTVMIGYMNIAIKEPRRKVDYYV
jgi:hypothetical protein